MIQNAIKILQNNCSDTSQNRMKSEYTESNIFIAQLQEYTGFHFTPSLFTIYAGFQRHMHMGKLKTTKAAYKTK